MTTAPQTPVTAAVLIIGDEILSGRTADTNLNHIATWLGRIGIRVMEARVVSDIEAEIVTAVNTLRARYTYVFTTGGIGPTHDDITADSIGKAFGLTVGYHPDAYALLEAHYKPGDFNEARKRMARTPEGASLIENPVSKAPGFQIGNVFVMAGIPRVMQAMLESLRPRLTGGKPLLSRTLSAHLPEGRFAAPLGALQARYPDVSMGSYPFYRNERYGASIVLRCEEESRLDLAVLEAVTMLKELGGDPVEGEPS